MDWAAIKELGIIGGDLVVATSGVGHLNGSEVDVVELKGSAKIVG